MRREVIQIATKLNAEIKEGAKHSQGVIKHQGDVILTFGISRGLKSGHGHLVGVNGNLKMNESGLLALARCTKSKEEYFEHLKQLGIIV